MRVLILLFAVAATSVAGPQRPFVDGASAKHLSQRGMLEIIAIANHNPTIRKPVFHIMVTDPDRAEVSSGREPKRVGDMYTTFLVRKKTSHWRLEAGSVEETERIRVYSNGIPVN